jgi:mRNA interferase MazF
MASKDYWGWNTRKIRLNSRKRVPFFHEREVWWTAIGHNVGDEENGKSWDFARPVLVLRKFNRTLFYGLPLSSSIKSGKYYYELTIKGKKNIVMLSHMRDYDAKRLIDRFDVIDEGDYARVQLALILILKEHSRF